MPHPDVSVIIAAYNEEKYLPECLASLKAQYDPRRHEVIVVDNNSTDRTASLARKWGAQVVTEEKQGIGPAKAKGASVAKGEILAFLDADITVGPDWLARIEHNISLPGVVATSGPYRFRLGTVSLKIVSFIKDLALKPLKGLLGGNCAVKRQVFQNIGGFSPIATFGEDFDLFLKIHKQGKVIFDSKLAVTESGRRYQHQGIIRTMLEYLVCVLGVVTHNPRLIQKVAYKPYR